MSALSWIARQLRTVNKLLYDYNVYIRDILVPEFAGKGHKVSTVDMYFLFLNDINDYDSPVAAENTPTTTIIPSTRSMT